MIRRIVDVELIRATITHPKVYGPASDDGSPSPDHCLPLVDESRYYLAAFDGDKYRGLLLFCQQNAICFDIHCALLPSAWGKTGMYVREAIEWMFKNSSCMRVVASVPTCNPLAGKLAMKSGFIQFGINEKSFMKNGQLYDQILFGVSKPCQ